MLRSSLFNFLERKLTARFQKKNRAIPERSSNSNAESYTCLSSVISPYVSNNGIFLGNSLRCSHPHQLSEFVNVTRRAKVCCVDSIDDASEQEFRRFFNHKPQKQENSFDIQHSCYRISLTSKTQGVSANRNRRNSKNITRQSSAIGKVVDLKDQAYRFLNHPDSV